MGMRIMLYWFSTKVGDQPGIDLNLKQAGHLSDF